jgi:hypothetical protein
MQVTIPKKPMIGNPITMKKKPLTLLSLQCDSPSFGQALAKKLGSTVSPGTHELSVKLVHFSTGGDGLKVVTSDASHEIFHGLCTLNALGTGVEEVVAVARASRAVDDAPVVLSVMCLRHASP